nr:MAG TPA: hypothetical protein [Caudoviricetes sp.]
MFTSFRFILCTHYISKSHHLQVFFVIFESLYM